MAAHVEKEDVDAWSVTKKIDNSGTKIIKIIATKAKTNKVPTPLTEKFEKLNPPRSLNDIKKRWHGIKSCFLRYIRSRLLSRRISSGRIGRIYRF